MKKILLTLGIAIASYFSLFAQWSNGMDIHNTTSGYVGIGTASPESGFKLDVNGLGAIGTQGSARVYLGTMQHKHLSNLVTTRLIKSLNFMQVPIISI